MAAVAAAEKAEHHPARAVLAVAGQRQGVDGAIGAGVGQARRRQREGAVDIVDHPQNGLGVAADRFRRAHRQQGVVGNHDGHRLEDAGVGRHIGEDMFNRHIDRGDGGGPRDIDRPGAGRRGARKVEGQAVAGDGQVEGDFQRRVDDAVIVEEILDAVGAVGQVGDMGAHQLAGAGLELAKRAGDGVGAEFAEQRRQPAGAKVEGVDLAVQIADQARRQARIGGHDVDNVLAQRAADAEFDRRDQHAFLEALGGHRVVIARHIAADVMPMADRGEIAKHLAVMEIGADQFEIRQMGAALVRVVEDVDVAGRQIAVAGRLVDHHFDRRGHRPDENRQARFTLDQGRAGDRVVKPVRGVMGLGDDRVERRPEQGGVHFIGDLLQAALEHRQGDRIDHRPVTASAAALAAPSSAVFALAALALVAPGLATPGTRRWRPRM